MTASRNMDLEIFLDKLENHPERIEFPDTIALINSLYDFKETGFRNGEIFNAPGQNTGSCKIFAFARLHDLKDESVLACFGAFYRADVLKNPESDSHQNIRQFMKTGWKEIEFDGVALRAK